MCINNMCSCVLYVCVSYLNTSLTRQKQQVYIQDKTKHPETNGYETINKPMLRNLVIMQCISWNDKTILLCPSWVRSILQSA